MHAALPPRFAPTSAVPMSTPPASDLTEPLGADDARYAALVARDAAWNGVFFYGVKTTGVFCKPSCGARTPRRENVTFYDSAAAARAAGFRACKRCHPEREGTDVHADVVTAMCRLIDEAIAADAPAPTLEVLAQRTGYSPFHLHRLFRSSTGTTPRAYAAAARATKLRHSLDDAPTVSSAIAQAGYSSTSRLYASSTKRLGMTPSRMRRGGHGETVRFAVGQTTLGALLVAATEKGVCAIQLGDDPEQLVHDLEHRFAHATLIGDDPGFSQVVARIVALVESPARPLDLPLDIRGTAFQERVWQALTRIVPGQTMTYSELAVAIGQPAAVRAVASACAANELAIAIPCHRVVRASGALAGYRWGIERKTALLQRERP